MTNKLPKGWMWTRLGEICLDPQYGWTTSAVEKGRLHLLRTTDITSGNIDWDSVPFCKKEPLEKEKYLLEDGDVVISRAGSVGYSYLIKNPENAVFASYLIRFKPLVDEQYLAYFLKSPSYWESISEKSLGIAIPNVNATKLKQINLPLSPLPEQYRIVAKIEEVFSNLDAGVDALKKIKEQLKHYRQAVLKYAFEGKLTEEWRQRMLNEEQENSKLKIQNSKLNDISKFKIDNSKLKELPELPERWVGTRIGKLVLFEYGKGLPKRKREKGSVPVYGSNGIVGYHSKSLVKGPCIIVGRKGAAGMVHLSKEDCWPIDTTYYVIPPVGTDIYFLYYLLYVLNLSSLDKSTAIPGLNRNDAYNIKIPLPPLLEQHKIVEEIERRFSIADEVEKVVEQSLKQAERLRQSILKRAFEGKLVPQDPSDPPASELLEQIKAKKVKKRKVDRKKLKF